MNQGNDMMKTDKHTLIISLSSGILLAAIAGCADQPASSASTPKAYNSIMMVQTQTNGVTPDRG